MITAAGVEIKDIAGGCLNERYKTILKQFYEQDALPEIPKSTRRIEELRYRMLYLESPKRV